MIEIVLTGPDLARILEMLVNGGALHGNDELFDAIAGMAFAPSMHVHLMVPEPIPGAMHEH